MRTRDLPLNEIILCIRKRLKNKLFPEIAAPHPIPLEKIKPILEKHHIPVWFETALSNWHMRWQASAPVRWMERHIPRNAKILETGAGCCINSLYLAAKGFTNLSAFDMEENPILAAREIFDLYQFPVRTWTGNGFQLKKAIPEHETYDVIFNLSWAYYSDEFDLDQMLQEQVHFLNPRGWIVMDFIDSSYNLRPNNQYLTWNWDLPEEQRRPSEFRKRHSKAEIYAAAKKNQLKVIAFDRELPNVPVPHSFAVFQKNR